jgi:nucleotide-binding universal stress UspA family protein
MLVCLDGSATSATIVPVVRSWALELELELHLLHVAYPLGDPLAGELRIPDEEEAATDQLIAVADALRAEGIATTWEVDEDTHAASGIVAKLRHRAFDLVALATHGRTGLSRLLAGSVATDVVRRAPARRCCCSAPNTCAEAARPRQLRARRPGRGQPSQPDTNRPEVTCRSRSASTPCC